MALRNSLVINLEWLALMYLHLRGANLFKTSKFEWPFNYIKIEKIISTPIWDTNFLLY